MKYNILLFAALITACNATTPAKDNPVKDSVLKARVDTPVAVAMPLMVQDTTLPPADSNIITGDFNGDGQTESAFVVRTKQGYGNPAEDGVPDEYALRFSDTSLPQLNIGCCEARLINEGDLNSDSTEEISVFQAPTNGNTYFMTTWTFTEHRWQKFSEPFIVPTAGEPVSDKDLQNKVFLENHIVYFWDIDPNDDNFKPVKKKAILR